MNSTRPFPASRLSSSCQNCPNRLAGTCESHAEKKITSNRVPGFHENTSATSKLTFAGRTRSRAIATASGAASIAVTVSAHPASASVHKPVPHAISSTLPAGRISATSRAICARAGQPAAGCEPHHVIHRAGGGRTSLGNLKDYWWHHHVVLHELGWELTVRPDGTSEVKSPSGKIIRSHSPPPRPG
jgi:hypothetical protein